MVKISLLASFLGLLTTGCTHVQLRNDALNQAGAVHQLQQRQVLDNLAMFVNDPNAVPYFTVVGAATSAVSDTGNASSSLGWLRTGCATSRLVWRRLQERSAKGCMLRRPLWSYMRLGFTRRVR